MADVSFIPPGQEQLVGEMLGNGITLPDDCKLVSGNAEKATIKATYSCRTGEVVVELAHPTAAPADATRTEKFALRVERGTAPPDLPNALLSRIRERESQFQWAVHSDGAREPPPRAAVPMLSSAVGLGVLLIAALLLWRRRARATQG
jgi:hypothetical protein